ncbi:MAG: DUF3499 family protein [Acidimicrobiia bacterium]
MARLCERPGCSEPGAAAYGMVPEDLLFWIAPLHDAPVDDHNVLCRRHADAMVVPRGWTLDDRREPVPRLFMPRRPEPTAPPKPSRRRAKPAARDEVGEQLQIDGTGEIARPAVPDTDGGDVPEPRPWQPEFDVDDDLDGLLEVRSPLLARAFRGTGRPRT